MTWLYAVLTFAGTPEAFLAFESACAADPAIPRDTLRIPRLKTGS
jgi:hypothetical protein